MFSSVYGSVIVAINMNKPVGDWFAR